MSDKGSNSPPASPDAARHQDSNDSANNAGDASMSPKSSPRAAGSPRNGEDANANAVAREGGGDEDAERRRATSRSPSPSGRKEPAANADPELVNPGNNLYVANLPHRVRCLNMDCFYILVLCVCVLVLTVVDGGVFYMMIIAYADGVGRALCQVWPPGQVRSDRGPSHARIEVSELIILCAYM